MKRALLLCGLVLHAGCTVATTTSSSSSTGPSTAGADGTFTVPNVFGMSKADALAALQRAGHAGSVSDDSSLCGSVVDGRVIELGEVCYQHPAAGQVMGVRLPVSLRVQTEDPRHGSIGKHTEWHLMPDVTGMTVDEARAALHAAGLTTDDRTKVSEVDEDGCSDGRVCRTYPEANTRSGLNSDRVLYVGAAP